MLEEVVLVNASEALASIIDDFSSTIAILSPLVAVAFGWLMRRSERLQQKIGDNAERISKLEGRIDEAPIKPERS